MSWRSGLDLGKVGVPKSGYQILIDSGSLAEKNSAVVQVYDRTKRYRGSRGQSYELRTKMEKYGSSSQRYSSEAEETV